MQKTSIIMAVFPDQIEYMKASLDSIRRFTKKGTYELIVVESGGSLEARAWLAEETDIRSLFFDQEITIAQAWNEGIRTANGDSILFIHEDTLVTENWLGLLLNELYEKESNGVVGPLTNSSYDDQAEMVQFSSMEELNAFAKGINETKLVEQRLTLSGFCLLVRKSVLENVGAFDEQLDGKPLIADFCLRMNKSGWKLSLCRHVYVHHYGINEVSEERIHRKRFAEKWGFSVESTKVESNVLKLINNSVEDSFEILVLGLGLDNNATALKIYQMYPNADVHYYNFDQRTTKLKDHKYDYIIVSSTINPEDALLFAIDLLTDHGQLIAEMSNIHYFGVTQRLLLGEGLEADTQYWRLADLPPMFEEAGYQELDFDYVFNDNLEEQDSSFITGLGELVEQLPQEFEISSFLVTARKVSKDVFLHNQFTKLLENPSEDILSTILLTPAEQIISSIEHYEGSIVPLLNYLGISNFERKRLDDVLPYLTKAYELEPANSSTIMNLATVMYSIGEDEEALRWLNSIEDKNEQIEKWTKEIQQVIYDKKLAATKVKFLLRRIENDVEREEASEELSTLIQQNVVSITEIIDSVSVDIVDKTGTLNRLAINSFNAGSYDVVIPLLENSYTIDPANEDTLFNLGYMLYKFGAFQEALSFVKQIRNPDEDTLGLRQDIEECINHE